MLFNTHRFGISAGADYHKWSFLNFSSVTLGKYRDITLKLATTASFHILSNILFKKHPTSDASITELYENLSRELVNLGRDHALELCIRSNKTIVVTLG